MYEKIKKWYEQGLWAKDMVNRAVPKLITAEQYEEITGEPYVPLPPVEDETEVKAEAFDILMGESE